MGRLGKVISSFISKLSGTGRNAQFASVEEFSGDQRKLQLFGPCNEDFSAPQNVRTIDKSLGAGRGFLVSTAYHNPNIAPVAVPGERRIFSTNSSGNSVQSEVFLKQDGTLLIKNTAGVAITLSPSGNLDIVTPGNTTFNTSGNFTVNAALATFNCPVNMTGLLSLTAGIESNGTSIDENHAHSGVQTGGGVTGGVV